MNERIRFPALISTPSAYPHLSQGQLDDLSSDLSTILHQCLAPALTSPSSSHQDSSQLTIIRLRKHWHIGLEAVILSDHGNIIDTLFVASRACLWDLRVPRTKGLEYRGPAANQSNTTDADMDVDDGVAGDALKAAVAKKSVSGNSKRDVADFELEDYWEDGLPLENRAELPVCITMNLVRQLSLLL